MKIYAELIGNYKNIRIKSLIDNKIVCQWAYNDNGISISRTTYTQITEGIEVTESQLQPADLIFTRGTTDNGHVFLYAGKNANGEHVCIEAQQTGTNIMERTFTWGSTYRARRIITS